MARKRTTRNGPEEGQVTIWLTPEELLQLKNICTIRMESNLEGFCRKLILEGLKREATDILSSVALSYRLEQAKVPHGDQETDLSSIEEARHACGPVSEHAPARTQADFSDGLIKFDPPELNNKGLRGGEADEESLHGTRNADLDSPCRPTSKDMTAAEYTYWVDKQGTLGANMQPAYLERSTVPSADRGYEVKGHEVDQYAHGSTRLTTNTELLKGDEDEA